MGSMRLFKSCHDSFAPPDLAAQFHQHLHIERQVKVAPRPVLDKADAFAALDLIAEFDPGHDPAREHSGDQADAHLLPRIIGTLDSEEHVLIVLSAISLGRVEKLSERVLEINDPPAEWGLLHVDIQDRKEDRNAP